MINFLKIFSFISFWFLPGFPNSPSEIRNPKFYGGEGGIRTHGTVSRSQHFQCCQFSHSCTSPTIAEGGLQIADLKTLNRSRAHASTTLQISNPKSAIRNQTGREGGM